MRITGRVVDLNYLPGTRDIVRSSGFRYDLTVGGLDNRPFYLLRGVPEDIVARVGKRVVIHGVEYPDYALEEYAVLKCATIEEAD